MTAGELAFAKVFKLKHALCIATLFALASCGGGSNGSSTSSSKPDVQTNTTGSTSVSTDAAKVIVKNSSTGTSAFVMSLLVAD